MTQQHPSSPRWIAGCMTGTSLDALDVVLACVHGRGLSLTADCIDHEASALGELRPILRAMAGAQPQPPLLFLEAARALGQLHAKALTALLARHPQVHLDLVCAHGQTICHAPGQHLSWQLFDPWPVVRALHVPVVYDLRQADLIAGGQGAPITPLADWLLYRHRHHPRAIINLGGICNITVLPADSPAAAADQAGPPALAGGDVCPCNLLLDSLVQALRPELSYDHDGQLAASATPRPDLAEHLEAHLAASLRGARSLGREQVAPELLAQWLDQVCDEASPAEILASTCLYIARRIAAYSSGQLGPEAQWVLAGGGACNLALRDAIAAARPPQAPPLILSDEVGIPLAAREALGFAVLGALAQDGLPITLPQVTGADNPGRAGAWAYP